MRRTTSASVVLGELVAADGTAWFAVKRAQIDIGLGIEHDPQRVGTMKNGGPDGGCERKRQFQAPALAGELDADRAGGHGAARFNDLGRRRRL